jgi:hypothetical protein
MRSKPGLKRGVWVTVGVFLVQLLTTAAPRTAHARVDPLNAIVRQLHKPNMLILLDTSGSLTGVAGGTFDPAAEVGVDCDDGVNCRGGTSVGTCAAAAKSCSTDSHCRTKTCRDGLSPCTSDSECAPSAGACDTGHACLADRDCPPQTSGTCALTGANCSLNRRCTQQLRCKRSDIACASDADCDPGVCADNVTACDTSDDCPHARSGGTCAHGITPAGGCAVNSDCPLRAKVCSNDPARTCVSVQDCGGVCARARTSCRNNGDCQARRNDYCDFGGRSCTNPTNTCLLPRQACTARYPDNRCEDRNTCVPTPNRCSGVTVNRCLDGVPGDLCNASSTVTGSRMCRIGQNKCDNDNDCRISGDSCGPASSRMVVAKRVLRSIVAANANVVNLGLMTFYQAGYFPYYELSGATTSTQSVEIKQGTLRANGCYSRPAGISSSCRINGQTYRLRSSNNSKYLIKGHGQDEDKYVDANYCGWFCEIPGAGIGIFRGAYFEYTDAVGTKGARTVFPEYRGKTFTESGRSYRYYDARPDYYNGGPPPPIAVAACGSSCSASCGARWDTQLAPFLTSADGLSPEDAANQMISSFNQALEPASYGGLIAYGGTPTGCALKNDAAPDRNHSAYHYMQQVKAQDSLQCRLNYVLLITDGEANGPGDSSCGSSACAAADPVAAGCGCRAVLAAYSMRQNLGVKTIVVGFSTDASAGSGFLANDNIARAGGTDVGSDGQSPFAYAAANEKALNQAIQDAIYTAVQGSYATSPSTASHGTQQGSGYASGSMVLDSRVDFPSWRGHLIAYEVAGDRNVLQWDAAAKLEAMDWRRRRVYTSDDDNNVFRIDIDPSSGAIRNADRLHQLGLGGSVEEAEKITRWMLGDPAMKNPAVLGAIINSTPIDVGPPIDGPLPGQTRFHEAHRDRPPLTYVGSNDGMLHAFHTRTVTVDGTQYEGGSEAFAYLPPNMMAMTSRLYAQGGQLADPRQHIYGGLANSPKAKSLCVQSCGDPAAAVWKTLLVVTQGWGGNEVFMLDVTDPVASAPSIYWSSIRQGSPASYDRALGLTVSVPAFTFHRTDGQDDYRLLLASGYAVDEGSTTQGRSLLSVSVTSGAVMDEEVLPGSGSCPQEYTLLSDVATSRKQFTNPLGQKDGRKEFLTAYLGDTWGKLWRYGPDAELVVDLGCDQPLHFSPTVVQLDADAPNNPNGNNTYLVQVTNSSLDDDTQSYGPSKMIILKEVNESGRPSLDTSFGVGGMITLVSNDTSVMCGVSDVTGTSCLEPLPPRVRPLSTPMAIPKTDGTGFFILSNWYAPSLGGCGKGATYFQVHEFAGNGTRLRQALKVADEPVLSPVIVGGKLIVSSSKGPVVIDGNLTTHVSNTKPPSTRVGDVFESGGWQELD